MKKIIVILLILCLTGCKDSSNLTNTCILEEKANTLSSKIIYTISFKSDIINAVSVNYQYNDTNKATISSIKLSFETQNKQMDNLDFSIINDSPNDYEISYKINNDSKEEIKKHFNYQDKRSKLVNSLKEKGYSCK